MIVTFEGLLLVALFVSAHASMDFSSLLQTTVAVSHSNSVPAKYFEDAVVPTAARRSDTRQKVLELPQDVVAPFDVGSDAVPMPKWMLEESENVHKPLILAQSTATSSALKENGPPISLAQANVTSPLASSPPPAQLLHQSVDSAGRPSSPLPEQARAQNPIDAGASRSFTGTRERLPSALDVVAVEPPLAVQTSVTQAPNANVMAALPIVEAPAYAASLGRKQAQVDANSPEVAARFVECEADATGDDCASASKQDQARASAEADLDKAIDAGNAQQLKAALDSAKQAGVEGAKINVGENMVKMIENLALEQAARESFKKIDPDTLQKIEQARLDALARLEKDAHKRANMFEQLDALEQRHADLLGVAKENHWITAPVPERSLQNSARQYRAFVDEMSAVVQPGDIWSMPSRSRRSQSVMPSMPNIQANARVPQEKLARLEKTLAQLSERLTENERIIKMKDDGSSI